MSEEKNFLFFRPNETVNNIKNYLFFAATATGQCLKLGSFSEVLYWPAVLYMWHCCSVSSFFPLQSCSYFTSNAFPLKISFINANAPSGNINVIFKVCYSSNPQVFWYGKWSFEIHLIYVLNLESENSWFSSAACLSLLFLTLELLMKYVEAIH